MILVEFDPPLLFAHIVYVVDDCIEVGVPQMLPLLVPNEIPEGKVGLICQEVIAPPKTTGFDEDIVVLTVRLRALGL